MTSLLRNTILSTAFAIVSLAMAAQTQIKVEVPNMVGSDEQFNVTFIIEGEDKPSNFDWSPGENFSIVWGPQQGSSTSIRIINGKRSKSSQYTYTYIIAPKKTGNFELPPAKAMVKGNPIASEPVAIEVLGGGSSSSSQPVQSGSRQSGNSASTGSISSEDLFMRFTLSRNNVVIGEPVTAELKLYQRVDIAGFENAKFPSFNGFWSQETMSPSNIEFHREDIGGKIYNAALLRRYVLIPQQAGTLTIDPAELVCLVNVRTASRTGNSIFDSFFDDGYTTVRKRITTPATQVAVRSLPSGAPADFGGGVGNFTITAKLSKDQVKTHEATSLIITVSGRGNVSLLEAPKVDFAPDLEVYDTKVSENTDKSTGGTTGSKVFEYPFIPRSYGQFAIGPVNYSYYDVNAGKYVTITAPEIILNVEKGEASETSGVTSTVVTRDRAGVKNLGEDIRFINVRQPSYKFNTVFFVGTWYYMFSVITLLLVTVAFGYLMRKLEIRRGDTVGNRNRRATKMALSRLKMADGFLKKNLYSAFYEELHRALLGFIADKLNMGVEDLNKENIAVQLERDGVSKELADEFISLLDACEFARYSPDVSGDAMNTHYTEAVTVISEIDSIMKLHKKGPAAAKVSALLITAFLMLPTLSKAADTAYLDSLWQAGTEAYTSGNWNGAILDWHTMEKAGLVSPELYYNLGNAYFKSGDNAHAILYYERTLKADPSFADARFNLEFANALIRDKIDEVPEFVLKTWVRNVNYMMDSNSWAILSLVFLAVALALFLLFRIGGTTRLRRAGFYSSIAVFLLAVFSFSMSMWQRNAFLKADYAIVMSPVSSVKSSPGSESAKDLFVLHDGTKVRILDSVGDWKNISLSDGRQGWIKGTDIEII